MRKLWKTIRYLIYATCAVFVISLGVVIGVGHWQRPVGQADAIIVLGAAIKTPAAYNRALEGLKLYDEGKAPVLVLSGGEDYPKSISEAQYMENAVLDEVAKESDSNLSLNPSPQKGRENKAPVMILEQNSQSTFENIADSKKLIPSAKSVIIVSDTYHLARGVITAKLAGFSPVYWKAPETSGGYSSADLVFHYLREAAALIDYLPKFALGH